MSKPLSKQFMRRINQRATTLRDIAFKDYQRRMVEEFNAQAARGNLGSPEDWCPQELFKKDRG